MLDKPWLPPESDEDNYAMTEKGSDSEGTQTLCLAWGAGWGHRRILCSFVTLDAGEFFENNLLRERKAVPRWSVPLLQLGQSVFSGVVRCAEDGDAFVALTWRG